MDNCDTAKAAFQQGSENGNGCFSTTCTSYLESGGLQRGSYRTYGCFCRPKHFWVDGPGEAEPFKPTARCALAARCPAVERHLATTPMWLHLTWTKGLAHYRTWVAGKQAAGVWRPNTAAGDIQSYVNETAVAATTRWLVHFLALHEGDRFAPAHVNPEPRWHLLKKEVVGATFSLSLSLSFFHLFSPPLLRCTSGCWPSTATSGRGLSCRSTRPAWGGKQRPMAAISNQTFCFTLGKNTATVLTYFPLFTYFSSSFSSSPLSPSPAFGINFPP